MKKLFSLILTVVMLCAVCVPGFAVDITKDSIPQTATADVVTKTTNTDGTDAYTYSVTIPTSIEITWGDTADYDAAYEVTSQLLLGAQLKVSVAANNESKMSNPNTVYTLTYALANGAEATFNELNTAAQAAPAPTVSIADFSGVPVAEYTGTLTYTVDYVAPTNP